jgi:8-oxo-dGTP pyrophosphatase MutT (NUDIX family)
MSQQVSAIHLLEEVRLTLSETPLPYEAANRAAIESHWSEIHAANPRLWNGPSFMFDNVGIEDGVLHGAGHRTDFATFMHWRENGRPDEVVHITGTALPVTADGALFAVRMASHTANAGDVYFPAGSFDAEDLVGGQFDVTRNVARELEEETGFRFDTVIDRAFIAAFDNGVFHITRRNRLAGSYDACARMLAEHQAATGDDELAGPVRIRPGDGSMGQLRPYARMLAEWHFANS